MDFVLRSWLPHYMIPIFFEYYIEIWGISVSILFFMLLFYGGYIQDRTLYIRAVNHQKLINIEQIAKEQNQKLNNQDEKLNQILEILI